MRIALTPPQMPTQRGPCCGLYALTAVARALDSVAYADLVATKGDDVNAWQGGGSSDSNGDYWSGGGSGGLGTGLRVQTKSESLRHIAKRLGVTKIGEVFESQSMVRLAREIGLQAMTGMGEWDTIIKFAIDKRWYVLAPFGVDSCGKPQSNGDRAHWCAVYGYEADGDEQPSTALVTHWGNKYAFNIPAFKESSSLLTPFNQVWGKVGKGLHFGKAAPNKQVTFTSDVPRMLAGQLVCVWR